MRSVRSLAVILGMFVVAGSLVGCDSEEETKGCVARLEDCDGPGGGGSGGGGPGPEPADGMAMIRIVHASSDAPAVDIWVAGSDKPLATGLEYGGASEWFEVPEGKYDVQIKASPSTESDEPVYSTGELSLEEGEKWSAIAAGELTSTADAMKFRVLTVREEFSPAGSGNAILRVVHASPDAPSVGIDLHNDDPSSPELTNIDRFTSTDEEGFILTAGEATQIGIAAGGQRVTAFTTPPLTEGDEILVIATGLVGEKADEADGFSLLAIGPTGAIGFVRQNPFVYALHASPNAPAVDLYAGEALLTSGLEFGNIAGPVQVPPGDYDIDFRAKGASSDSDPAATASTGALEAGNTYLSIATGFLGGPADQSFRLVSLAEKFGEGTAENALVRVVHGSPDAPMVDLGVLNFEGVVNPVLVNDLSFGASTADAGLDVGLGTIPIGVTPASDNNQVVASFHVTTAPGLRAFAIAAGALDNAKGQHFRLLVVDTASSPWTVGTIEPQPQ